jgi:hypothetical protein
MPNGIDFPRNAKWNISNVASNFHSYNIIFRESNLPNIIVFADSVHTKAGEEYTCDIFTPINFKQ